MLIGALAYRSAKKRKLGEVKDTILRKIVEGIIVIGIIAMIILQNDLKYLIATDSVPNFVILVFMVIDYLVASIRKKKQSDGQPQ